MFVNDQGVWCLLGGGGGASTFYCGRRMPECRVPGCDGHCGNFNGPQCNSCKRFQESYLVKNDEGASLKLSKERKGHYYCGQERSEDGLKCGPDSGPQCSSCERFQREVAKYDRRYGRASR